MMARSTNAPFKGRIQKRKTNHLQIIKSSLQRTAGPYKSAMNGTSCRRLHDIASSLPAIFRFCRIGAFLESLEYRFQKCLGTRRPVDLDWLLGHLDKRSFGLLLLLLGLLVIVPGVASIASLIVLFPSVEMMLGRSRPTFPQFLSRRPFDFKRFKRVAERVQPALRAIENLSRPRWTLPHAATGCLVGAVYSCWRCRPSGPCRW